MLTSVERNLPKVRTSSFEINIKFVEINLDAFPPFLKNVTKVRTKKRAEGRGLKYDV